ncbi:MAG: NifB/NifX family molybdenum-iron cluster-binding protein [Candidatus Hermodarchaeota archaeon]|nr:NifB/NifX family molybdenum-iron cluster-binding protein [Candidatus Hermodarchaeota archaeon]
MVERIVVPVLDETGEAAKLSPHFGRAPFFAVAEMQADGRIENLSFQPNRSEHFGGGGRPPDIILQFKPNVVITFGMGPRAMRRFQAVGVAVMQATSETLGEVLSAFAQNELNELTEGCRDARHK